MWGEILATLSGIIISGVGLVVWDVKERIKELETNIKGLEEFGEDDMDIQDLLETHIQILGKLKSHYNIKDEVCNKEQKQS